jgi:hypothetical protein
MINAEAALNRTLKKFKGFFAGIEDEYPASGAVMLRPWSNGFSASCSVNATSFFEAEGRVRYCCYDLSRRYSSVRQRESYRFCYRIKRKLPYRHRLTLLKSGRRPRKITGEVADGDPIIVDGTQVSLLLTLDGDFSGLPPAQAVL